MMRKIFKRNLARADGEELIHIEYEAPSIQIYIYNFVWKLYPSLRYHYIQHIYLSAKSKYVSANWGYFDSILDNCKSHTRTRLINPSKFAMQINSINSSESLASTYSRDPIYNHRKVFSKVTTDIPSSNIPLRTIPSHKVSSWLSLMICIKCYFI